MKRTGIVIGALIAGAVTMPARAQMVTPELRPFVGAYMPTGGQRELFKSGALIGMQGALELTPTLHLLGTFGWVPGHAKFVGVDENVSIFAYDVGTELGFMHALGWGWDLKPFVGLGAGARTYSYKASNFSSQTCAAGYGALGTEFQFSKVALRLEGRENVYCFKSPLGGVSRTRNDVGLAFGLAYHFR
jgi:hypothetical protein